MVVAWELQEAVELLEGISRSLPPPADLADRQEHRKPYEVATDVLADDELARDFQEREAARHAV